MKKLKQEIESLEKQKSNIRLLSTLPDRWEGEVMTKDEIVQQLIGLRETLNATRNRLFDKRSCSQRESKEYLKVQRQISDVDANIEALSAAIEIRKKR